MQKGDCKGGVYKTERSLLIGAFIVAIVSRETFLTTYPLMEYNAEKKRGAAMLATPAQQEAIASRNSELLVSAAAGSGKTRVLIQRILSLIQEDGYSMDRMLVVTFTHAAAAEMRDRLETQLTEAALQDRSMQRQMELVETAQISTLHSFCQKLIREYFETVEIDPQATLCSEVQSQTFLQESLEACLNEIYEEALTDPDLRTFTVKFAQKEIEEMLLRLHSFLMAQPHPFPWLEACAQHVYTPQDLREGPMAETLLADARVLLEGALSVWEGAASLADDPFLREGYLRNYKEDGTALQGLAEATQQGLEPLMAAMKAASFGRMASLRLTDSSELAARDRFKEVRGRYKDLVAEAQKHLPLDEAQAISDLEKMQPALRGLSKAVRRMYELYAQRKNERNCLDFSDLEHMTLEILEYPEIRRDISARYDAIFVDEYQDISGIQEAILSALKPTAEDARPSGEKANGPKPSALHAQKLASLRFYVGDVKQSIYRFRQADPTLFMDKLAHFRLEADAPQRKISLNQNFRSRETVLSSVNRVFEHVMRPSVTEIDYDEDAQLHPGKASAGDPATELHIVGGDIRASQQPQAEAQVVGQEILRLVGTPSRDWDGNEGPYIRYKDIAILLPKAKGVADEVERVLSAMGIPVYSEENKGTLESEEIRQALGHLRLMDNLMDDLALLAALRGPVYAMTEAELADIRLMKPERGASFLEALTCAAQAGEGLLAVRCQQVLDDLHHERFLLNSMPLDEYLWDFLGRSGMYGFYGAQPGGKLRQANLRMLCHQAGEHMRSRGSGLTDFLYSVSAQSGAGDSRSPTVMSPWEDVVRIMTIHKSKGLEFPYVFVMGLGQNLHHRQDAGILSMHPRLGVALKYINEDARTKRTTLLAHAIAMRARAEDKAERARLLYVALTRAKEKLYMVGSVKADAPEVILLNEETTQRDAYHVWEAKSMLEWIGQTAQNTDDIRVWDHSQFSTSPLWETEIKTNLSTESTFFPHKWVDWRVVFHIGLDKSSLTQNEEKSIVPGPQENISLLMQSLEAQRKADAAQQKTNAMLPDLTQQKADSATVSSYSLLTPAAPAAMPLKIGVTAYCRSLQKLQGLSPWEGEPEDAEAESPEVKRLPLTLSRPHLLSDLPTLPAYLRPDAQQSGLARGVATHKALSLLSLDAISLPEEALQEALETQLSLQKNKGLLSKEELDLINVESLVSFFKSPLGRRSVTALEKHREWSFNLFAPDLCPSILQGVIDLCFLEEDQWVLVDYKTDRVSSAQELWDTYALQMALYARALSQGTGKPIKECTLFALSLGEGATRQGQALLSVAQK